MAAVVHLGAVTGMLVVGVRISMRFTSAISSVDISVIGTCLMRCGVGISCAIVLLEAVIRRIPDHLSRRISACLARIDIMIIVRI